MQPDTTLPKNKKVKEYIGIFTQSGTSNPIVSEQFNTYNETFTWTRVSLGIYKITGNGVFTEDKTVIEPFTSKDPALTYLLTRTGGSSMGLKIKWISVNEIQVQTYSSTTVAGLATPKEYSDNGGEILIKISTFI